MQLSKPVKIAIGVVAAAVVIATAAVLIGPKPDKPANTSASAVLLAPAYGPLFSPGDVEGVDVEPLVVFAEADHELPSGHVEALLAAMPPTTETVTVEGGHYVFLRTCAPVELAEFPEFCEDDETVDRALVHSLVIAEIKDHLSR